MTGFGSNAKMPNSHQQINNPIMSALADPESDTVDLANAAGDAIWSRGIYVGVTGNVKVDLVGEGTVTFIALAAGIVHPIRASRVYDTGTTATSVMALY